MIRFVPTGAVLSALALASLSSFAPAATAAPVDASAYRVPVAINGHGYVLAQDATRHTLVVRTDGTPAGTTTVQRLCVPPRCDGPATLAALGSRIVVASQGVRGAVFVSRPGTEHLVRRFKREDSRRAWATFVAGDRMVVARATRKERWSLWSGDLAHDRLRRLTPARFGLPLDVAARGDRLVFLTADRAGSSVWGIRQRRVTRLAAANPGGSALSPAADGRVIFSGIDSAAGVEPWVTDGTKRGTRLIADATPGPADTLLERPLEIPGGLAAVAHRSGGNDALLRLTPDSVTELARGSGWTGLSVAPDGRLVMRDFTTGANSFDPASGSGGAIAGGAAFAVLAFAGAAPLWSDGKQLWRADDQSGARTVVRTFPVTLCSKECLDPITTFETVGRSAYFVINGTELWATDGTADGTVQLIAPAT